MHLIYRNLCHQGGESDSVFAGGENYFVIEGKEHKVQQFGVNAGVSLRSPGIAASKQMM